MLEGHRKSPLVGARKHVVLRAALRRFEMAFLGAWVPFLLSRGKGIVSRVGILRRIRSPFFAETRLRAKYLFFSDSAGSGPNEDEYRTKIPFVHYSFTISGL